MIARCFLTLLTCVATAARLPAQLPEAGYSAPELAAFDDAMQSFMDDEGIEAGVLAVMKDGWVVHERAYGWKDSARSIPLREDALMRLASVSKPLTASAIRALVASGDLDLDDRAFDLGQPGGGVLALTPFPSLGDPRLADVTIRHLLDHTGGWDRAIAGDLTYREVTIAGAMGVTSPPGRANTVRYILGQPLQYAPGTTYAYSNIGYLVLGMIVEATSGTGLVEFLHREILAPLRIRRSDVRLGRTFPSSRNPREPWYSDAGLCQNVFDPTGPLVPCPDGGWDHEARVGQGGLTATAAAVVRFLDHHYISGPSIGAPRTGSEGPTWRRNHTGSLAGTSTLARQRGDGVNYAVYFNERAPAGEASYSSRIRTILDLVADNIASWPRAKKRKTQPGLAPQTRDIR